MQYGSIIAANFWWFLELILIEYGSDLYFFWNVQPMDIVPATRAKEIVNSAA